MGSYSLETYGKNGVGWTPRDDRLLTYVEAYHYEKLEGCKDGVNYRHGELREAAVEGWLQRKQQIERPGLEHVYGRAVGGLRILFCERSAHHPPKVNCTESTFLQVCKAFELAGETEASLSQILGSYGKHHQRSMHKLQILIKAHQKKEVGNFTISLTYNAERSWTNALVIWKSSTAAKHKKLDGPYETRQGYILAMLESMPWLWAEPLLVPFIFLRSYVERARIRTHQFNNQIAELDADLGVNQAGRVIAHPRALERWPSNLPIKDIMRDLHSLHNRIIHGQQFMLWGLRCLCFILEMEKEIRSGRLLELSHQPLDEMQECLEYEISLTQRAEDSLRAQKARAENATNLLFNAISNNEALKSQRYNEIAQEQSKIARRDNQLNIKIASSTKADGVAMKTFTFITALFLPGTFIGTLLSTTTIDWLPSTDNVDSLARNAKVSSLYWIYWVLTIPITLLVMIGWWRWYKHETNQWLQHHPELLEED